VLAVPLTASAARPLAYKTSTVTVPDTIARTCASKLTTKGAAVRRSFRAPSEGFVQAKLRGARSTDLDIGIFKARTGELIAGSANLGSNEDATGFVAKGMRVRVQVCRRSGSQSTANLKVRFWKAKFIRNRQRVQLVKIAAGSQAERERLQALGLDLTDHPTDKHWDAMLFGRADARKLKRAGFRYSVEIADVAKQDRLNRRADRRVRASASARARIAQATPGGRTTYRTLEEINDELKALARDNPSLVRLFTLPLKSYEGKDIFGIEIAENVTAPPDGRPAYIQVGTHHAREWPANEATMEWGLELINSYKSGSDPRRTQIVKAARNFIIPVLNVDGFDVTIKSEQASQDGDLADPDDSGADPDSSGLQGFGSGAYKRKTCRPPTAEEAAEPCLVRSSPDYTADPDDDYVVDTNGDGVPDAATFLDRGVDPNRNYGVEWGGPGTNGPSPEDDEDERNAYINSLVYHGPAPFSESETEGMRRFLRDLQPTVLITNHTYTGLILRPPGTSTFGPTPDEQRLRALGDAMARETNYLSQFSYQLYDTTGTTDDYLYDALGAFSYTPEIGKQEFHPAYTTGFVPEYDGQPELDENGNPTGRKLGGLREAYTLAGLTAISADSHSVIRGTAPAGRTLRIAKSISYKTSERPNDNGYQNPVQTITENRQSTMVVPSNGTFEWHTNPSSQPRLNGETAWRLTCEDGNGNVLETRDVYVARAQAVDLALSCGQAEPAATCPLPNGFKKVDVRRRGRGLRFTFSRQVANRVTVEVFQTSQGRNVFSKAKRRIRFTNRERSFNWNGKARGGKRLRNGVYYVRFRIRDANNRLDSRRLVVERKNSRFKKKTGYVLRDRCA
jgi:hypothetical protein